MDRVISKSLTSNSWAVSAASAAVFGLLTAAAQAAPAPQASAAQASAAQPTTLIANANPNGTGVANGRTGGQPMPDEPLPAQPQAQPTPSQ